MNDSTNLPIHREQMGNISASIWMNQTDAAEAFYVTTFSRAYRDPDSGEWKDASSFGQRDLLVVALIAQQAAQKISELTQNDRRARTNEAETESTQNSTKMTAAHEQQHAR